MDAMANVAFIFTTAGAVFAACCARGLAMRTAKLPLHELGWYTVGTIVLAVSAVFWASTESGIVPQQRIILGALGALCGATLLIFFGEWVRPTKAQTWHSESSADSGSVNSTGQSGGVTAGTIIINPLHPADNKQTIDQISSYMRQANQINKAWIDTNNTDTYITDSNKSEDDVYNFLNTALGVSYAEQFLVAAGTSAMGMPFGHSIVGGGKWQEMRGKVDFLSQLIGKLREQ
jgi:hypothetical protein